MYSFKFIRMKKLLFLSLFFIASVTFAQNFSLSGKVTQGETPLQGALVYAKNSSFSTSTDANGDYLLELPDGDYEIVFSFGNSKTVKITINENKVLNVDLNEAVESLDEVSVRAVRVNADSPITHSNLGKRELAKRNLGSNAKHSPSA